MRDIIVVQEKKVTHSLLDKISFEKKLKRKYGTTWMIDLNSEERCELSRINSLQDLSPIDGRTGDKLC